MEILQKIHADFTWHIMLLPLQNASILFVFKFNRFVLCMSVWFAVKRRPHTHSKRKWIYTTHFVLRFFSFFFSSNKMAHTLSHHMFWNIELISTNVNNARILLFNLKALWFRFYCVYFCCLFALAWDCAYGPLVELYVYVWPW